MARRPEVLTLPVELTHDQARSSLAQLVAGIGAEGAQVLVDAGRLERFDSSALAVLLELRRASARAGKTLMISGSPKHLTDLATLYGIEGLLPQA
jgi:phospholipid transport system transporter-binding protein